MTLRSLAVLVGLAGIAHANSFLYVSSTGNNEILQYNGSTGAPVGDPFVSSGSGGLSTPWGLVFGRDGNL